MPDAITPSARPVDTMLAVSDVITNERLARVYDRALRLDSPTVEEIAAGLDSSASTAYEDVNRLTRVGLLERVTDAQPHRYRAERIEMTVRTGDESYEITPTLIAALARRSENETLDFYVDRHGVGGLAVAVEYARQYARGRMNARIMAREQELPVLEAETILQALRDVLLEVDPELETDLDLEALDRAVDDLSEE